MVGIIGFLNIRENQVTWKELAKDIENCFLYVLLFFVHAFATTVWYFIAFLAAKFVCLSDKLNIPGPIAPYVFKGLELFILILGAAVAVVYFISQAYLLLKRIVREARSKQNN